MCGQSLKLCHNKLQPIAGFNKIAKTNSLQHFCTKNIYIFSKWSTLKMCGQSLKLYHNKLQPIAGFKKIAKTNSLQHFCTKISIFFQNGLP